MGGPCGASKGAMKQFLTAVLIVSSLLAAGGAGASLDRSVGGARSQGMGGAFVSVADDRSALFVNPAGMVSTGQAGVYLDYAEPQGGATNRESRIGLGVPAGGTSVGLGWYRSDARDVSTESLLIVGAARKLVEGTQGSYLSVGAGVSIASASVGGRLQSERRSRKSDVTADAGIILKPLPVVSFGYSVWNIRDADLGTSGGERWSRVQRWGVSYSWEEKIILSLEREHGARSRRLHYGLSARTAVPLELMAGFSEGSAAGGVRWLGSRFRAAVSFASEGGGAVTWTTSCEIAFRRASTGGTK